MVSALGQTEEPRFLIVEGATEDVNARAGHVPSGNWVHLAIGRRAPSGARPHRPW